jgi:hypothetical protein
MPEWWSYGLSDFLLFSPRTYYRLIERYNESIWPWQVPAFGAGFWILLRLRRPTPRQDRAIWAILATLWAWVAWAFVWSRYATINWAAAYFVWLFAAEVLLLVWVGVVRGGLLLGWRRDAAGIVGLALFISSLVLYPALALLLGRGWEQAEVFGGVPDPTVLGTLGVLALARGRRRWSLLVAPTLWCAISGATLWAMGSPEAWVLLSAAILVPASCAYSSRRPLGGAPVPSPVRTDSSS